MSDQVTALDMMHGLVLDDGRRWGEAAVEWQRADARAVLEPGPGDPRLHWMGRPKGGSKSTDLAGMCSAWLSVEAGPLQDGYAVAADRDQANRLLDKARGFIARTSGLDEVLEVQSHRILNRQTGARVNALEADVASSEGLLTPFVVVDELPNWADTPTARRMWTSVFSAVPKWPGMRLVVIGHAGDPAHWSRQVLDVALAHGWRVNEVPGPLPWVRAEDLEMQRAMLLPSEFARRHDVALAHGWRVNEVPGPLPWVRAEDLEMQRAMLLPSEFARRHLNVWTTAEDRLTTAEDLDACVVLDGPQPPVPGRWYMASLDVGLKNDRTVAAVMSLPSSFHGRVAKVRLDRMGVWEGSRDAPVDLDEVEAWLAQALSEFQAPLVVDPYQAAQLTQRLRARGWRVLEYTFSAASVGRLARRMFQQISDHALELPDDEELLEELRNVRLQEKSPGVWRMDHDAGRHDDRATALALGCWGLLDSDLLSIGFGESAVWSDELEWDYLADNGISPL